jgi:hypothetical protein
VLCFHRAMRFTDQPWMSNDEWHLHQFSEVLNVTASPL